MVDYEPVISKRALVHSERHADASEHGTCYRHELDAAGNAGIFAMRGAKKYDEFLPDLGFADNPEIPNAIAAEVGRPKHAASVGDNPEIPNAIAAGIGAAKQTFAGLHPERVAEFAGEGGPKETMLKGDCVASRLKHPMVMSKRTDIPGIPFF
jgi:hypothetical protein